MTVIMSDAHGLLSDRAKASVTADRLYDLLYADDTLLIGLDAADVEELASAVEVAGGRFGLKLHWGTTRALSVCTNIGIKSSDGTLIPEAGSVGYLGGLISEDGRFDSELSRKIGTAAGDFKQLRTVWNRAKVSKKDKLRYLDALVISWLLYGTAPLWLVTSQRRRLDGFYARCLRNVLGIPAAFISRVSNTVVLEKAGVAPLSAQLLKRQLALLGKVALSPLGHPLRRDAFLDNTLHPQIGRFIRRRGRQRQDWINEVMKEASKVLGDRRVTELLTDKSPEALPRWNQALRNVLK